MKTIFGYYLNDQLFPPTLYRVENEDVELGMLAIVPANQEPEPGKLARVAWVYPDDFWVMSEF